MSLEKEEPEGAPDSQSQGVRTGPERGEVHASGAKVKGVLEVIKTNNL